MSSKRRKNQKPSKRGMRNSRKSNKRKSTKKGKGSKIQRIMKRAIVTSQLYTVENILRSIYVYIQILEDKNHYLAPIFAPIGPLSILVIFIALFLDIGIHSTLGSAITELLGVPYQVIFPAIRVLAAHPSKTDMVLDGIVAFFYSIVVERYL